MSIPPFFPIADTPSKITVESARLLLDQALEAMRSATTRRQRWPAGAEFMPPEALPS
ncbi:MAG: hypothetical protein JWR15_1298 [Prosthecobacter sp.]|nr:hypothetical protein [Prosthecobacter sp.]